MLPEEKIREILGNYESQLDGTKSFLDSIDKEKNQTYIEWKKNTYISTLALL